MRNKRGPVGIEMEDILILLKSGYAAHSVAKKLRCSTSNIFQRLQKRGIKLAPERKRCLESDRSKIFLQLNPDLMS